jgi:prephenate dehydrogenase
VTENEKRKLAFAVFATLTPHRQLLAQKWASPSFGFAHPPPFEWRTTQNWHDWTMIYLQKRVILQSKI